MLAGAATYFEKPVLLTWFNVSAIFYDPINAHLGLAMLTYQLGYFDILPLYVVLMIAAPLIVLIYRLAPGTLLPVSLAIYLWALVFECLRRPGRPRARGSSIRWPGNFSSCWAFSAREEGLGGLVRPNLRIRLAPVRDPATLMVWFRWWPDADARAGADAAVHRRQDFRDPLRLIEFLSLIAVFSALYPLIVKALAPPLVDFLSMLGRNSLQVFCTASVLSLAGQILRFYFRGGFVVDTILVGTGIILLGHSGVVVGMAGQGAGIPS